jgi:hypothetical protein
MANLKVTTLSVDKLILSTPSLQEISKRNIITICCIFAVFISFGLFLKREEYNSLLRESNQGYLYELTCERQEKNLVHCKLDQTDTNGQKVRAFSTPIKSATSSVVTTDEYTCYISFVKRNGERINNIELFTTTESSSNCPSTKQTVKQINEYILGKGNTPLSWRKDTRVGDLTKSYQSFWQDSVAIFVVFSISFMFSLPPILGLVFEPEESWEFNSYTKKAKRSYRNRLFQGEESFSLNHAQELEYTYYTFTLKCRDSNRTKRITLSLNPTEDRDKAKRFLEKATGLTAKEIVSDD